jgi:hypothetical protein
MKWERIMIKKITVLMLLQLLMVPLCRIEAVELLVRLYDRMVYSPETPIHLHVTLKNSDTSPFRFHAADKRIFNLDFDVRNLRNLPLDHSQHFKIERTSSQRVFYREVVLLPGEEYSFIADLKDYIEIPVPGVYTVQTMFYPDMDNSDNSNFIDSNILTIQVHPQLAGIPAYRDRIDIETGRILAREHLPPDEVVSYMIQARQKSQWPRFFLYLDTEKLMLKDSRRRIEYRNKSEEERFHMVEQYQEALQRRQVNADILLVPTTFSVVNTSYTSSKATVEVIQSFEYPDFTEKRSYTYHLHRENGYWMIYDYFVRQLGTE